MKGFKFIMKNEDSKPQHGNAWSKIILAMIAFFFQFIVIGITFNPHPNEFIKIRIASFLTKICIIIIACLFTKYIDKRRFDFLGIKFEKFRSLKLFGTGCLIVLIQLIFIDTCAYLFKFVEDSLFNFSAQSVLIGILIFFIHTLFTGISEEMLFRGYILGNLLEKYSEFKAIIISSILFTLIHVSSVLKFIDYLDYIGNRIYQKVLTFVMVYAFKELFGYDYSLKLCHPIDKAIKVRSSYLLTEDIVLKLKDKMKEIIDLVIG